MGVAVLGLVGDGAGHRVVGVLDGAGGESLEHAFHVLLQPGSASLMTMAAVVCREKISAVPASMLDSRTASSTCGVTSTSSNGFADSTFRVTVQTFTCPVACVD